MRQAFSGSWRGRDQFISYISTQMKVETAISDLLMKCEEKGIQLPEDPWLALRVTIKALRAVQNQDLGYLQISKALEQLKSECYEDVEAMEKVATTTSLPRVVSHQKRKHMQDTSKRGQLIVNDCIDYDQGFKKRTVANAKRTVASGKKKKTKSLKKSRIQEQVEATPAIRGENQSLVNQLLQLGEYEMAHGYTQRGLARLRGAKEICNSQLVITSGAQAKKLDHVGPVVATKVDQLLRDGLEAALSEYDGDDEALSVSN